MIARLRSMLLSIRASYWFYPGLFALVGFMGALLMIHFDRSGSTAWLDDIGMIHPARPQGASNMLTVLAGSMIGVASTVFSITIAAVAYASGNYGPRLLNNFMEDRGNQLSLATFIGTFVYSITVLRAVRAPDETAVALVTSQNPGSGFVPQLSLLVAFALMMVAVGTLVFFLHHIPSSIRINSVLSNIGKRLLKMIDNRYPDEGEADPSERDAPGDHPVAASGTGYIRLIALDQLATIASKHDLRICLQVRTGDFVQPGSELVRIDGEPGEDLAGEIRDCMVLGASRTPEQDLEFSLDELVEIALRALSPGINDPFTALAAIHWLGAATAKLGNRDLITRFDGQAQDKGEVALRADGFAHFLNRGFGSARSAIATSPVAAKVTLDTMLEAARIIASADRRKLIADEMALLVRQAERALSGPDLEELRERHRTCTQALGSL